MAILDGDVNVGVNVRGKGDADKKVDQVKGSLDGMNKKLGEVRERTKPVNALREGFENLRSNGLFLVGAIGSVVGALVGLAEAFDDNAQAIKAWEEAQSRVSAALEETGDLIEDVQIKLGKRPPKTDLEKLGEAMRERWAENADLIDKATEAVAAHAEELEATRRRYTEYSKAYDLQQRKLNDAQTKLNELLGVQRGLLAENIDLLNEMARVAGQGFREDVLGAGGKPFFERWKADGASPRGPRGPGGGRARPPADEAGWDAFLEGLIAEANNGASGSSGQPDNQSLLSLGLAGEGTGGKGKSRVQMLAEDIRDFSAALAEALPGMQEFQAALFEISSLWGEYASGQRDAASATILSLGAIAKAGAQSIKDERLRAGVLSVIELGLGTGLMFVPGRQAEAASHFAAAGILGGVALFGSSSGGGAASSRSPSRSISRPLMDQQGSGGVTMVFNDPYIAGHTPQETAAELHARLRRGRSSGHASAA